jgi:hypothetical protein
MPWPPADCFGCPSPAAGRPPAPQVGGSAISQTCCHQHATLGFGADIALLAALSVDNRGTRRQPGLARRDDRASGG